MLVINTLLTRSLQYIKRITPHDLSLYIYHPSNNPFYITFCSYSLLLHWVVLCILPHEYDSLYADRTGMTPQPDCHTHPLDTVTCRKQQCVVLFEHVLQYNFWTIQQFKSKLLYTMVVTASSSSSSITSVTAGAVPTQCPCGGLVDATAKRYQRCSRWL